MTAPGIYRVVGTTVDAVTLLRLTDGDDRRIASGELASVSPERLETAFEPAGNPDDEFRAMETLRGFGNWVYWEVHMVFSFLARLFRLLPGVGSGNTRR
ncbi:hypothetical protein [Haloarchaeobius sp. DFWS5]|uniref:hypothetical protein n=1 Tax=Haloarchaeobius sp. DFWS5 TaxID=3446114 RepID=UPI003EB8E9F2